MKKWVRGIIILAFVAVIILGYGYFRAAAERNFAKGLYGLMTNGIELPQATKSDFIGQLKPWEIVKTSDKDEINKFFERNSTPASAKTLADKVKNFYNIDAANGYQEMLNLKLAQKVWQDAEIPSLGSQTQAISALTSSMQQFKTDFDSLKQTGVIEPDYKTEADNFNNAANDYYNLLAQNLASIKAGQSTSIDSQKLDDAYNALVNKVTSILETKVDNQKKMIQEAKTMQSEKFKFN